MKRVPGMLTIIKASLLASAHARGLLCPPSVFGATLSTEPSASARR
jgi:hypothetical protein